MAKIYLTTQNQHNQETEENLSALASLGVLICMIVTVMGIKLWWFKHRLSFEQKNTATTSGSSSTTPAAIVPRRSSQQKYKKDKRYSQQIYESVEVHGVFRQKREDELEIQRNVQLPPVRIRQTSENASSLILPPPRTKRRDQVHSTAFEDLEIVTPAALVTASSSDLSAITELNTKITLTFEEFERQFNLKEIQTKLPHHTITNNEVIEIPVPPLRLNRSSSTLNKPEKPQRFLKSSQSVTIPEFQHKAVEKRPAGFSSPKDDLTKIDFYEKTKMFENFEDPKTATTAGYIKYEEVDNDLHERELNMEEKEQNNGFDESLQMKAALKALRNDHAINNNNSNQSPDISLAEESDFNNRSLKINQWQMPNFSKENFMIKTGETKEIPKEFGGQQSYDTNSQNKFKKDGANFAPLFVTESETFKEEISAENNDNYLNNQQRPNNFFRDTPNDKENSLLTQKAADSFEEEFIAELQTPTAPPNSNTTTLSQDKQINEQKSFQSHEKNCFAADNSVEFKKYQENFQTPFTLMGVNASSASFEEDFDNQFVCWPQFEEKIETPIVTVRRFKNVELQPQSSFDDKYIDSHSNENSNEHKDEFSTTERKSVSYRRESPNSLELQDLEEWQECFNNKFYNQLLAVKPSTSLDEREVSFDTSVLQQIENENNNDSAAKQRRPTGYIRKTEYFVTLNDESDKETKRSPCFNTISKENVSSKVKFDVIPSRIEAEKFTLNQRRPTGFVRPLDTDDYDTTVINNAEETAHSIKIQTSPPNGFVKKLETLDLSDNEALKEGCIQEENYLKNQKYSQISPTVRFLQAERYCTLPQIYTESLVKQRRPTGYVRENIFLDSSSGRFMEIEKSDEDCDKNIESLVKQRRPTGYVREEAFIDSPTVRLMEIEKSCVDPEHEIESLVKQRILAGYKREEGFPKSASAQFFKGENSSEDCVTNTESLAKQRNPTGYVQQEERYENEKQINLQLKNSETYSPNEELQQIKHDGLVEKDEAIKHVSFQLNQGDEKTEYLNEQLQQRRPTGFFRRNEYQSTSGSNKYKDFDDQLWQELEKDVALDFFNNFEEEFAKIRHSYELNEADFLELKDELQKSPTDILQQPLGFGKTIDDDWENFEKLKSQIIVKPLLTPKETIKITFTDNDLVNTTSILKDAKLEEDVQTKPRKSKVTFDIKTEEHFIPPRKSHNYSEQDTDYFDDVYNKSPPPVPPQPVKRVSNINYNNKTALTPLVAIPKSITLFGSQAIPTENNDAEDSWTAIRQHRNMTDELQNSSFTFSRTTQSPTESMPPKAAYRNPMAQLAIQRAKEVRADMEGFKSRSINDRKPETSSRPRQKLLNLSNVDYEGGTEA